MARNPKQQAIHARSKPLPYLDKEPHKSRSAKTTQSSFVGWGWAGGAMMLTNGPCTGYHKHHPNSSVGSARYLRERLIGTNLALAFARHMRMRLRMYISAAICASRLTNVDVATCVVCAARRSLITAQSTQTRPYQNGPVIKSPHHHIVKLLSTPREGSRNNPEFDV